MLEWLKRHAWKACIRQKRIPSSNLGLSALKGLPSWQAFCVGETWALHVTPSLNPSPRGRDFFVERLAVHVIHGLSHKMPAKRD